jgi:ATP-dependent Clp protease protease subunit
MFKIPHIIEKNVSYDVYSRLMKDRIILLTGEINDDSAESIISQLLYLNSVDQTTPIHMYINSRGGMVDQGMAIHDIMKNISAKVHTYCVGIAASMGAFLLASGEKGNRYALKNANIMIHQVLGGASGQCSDVQIAAEHLKRTKDKLNEILSEYTGKTKEEVEKDTDRDNFLTALEAKEYGLIDEVI